jgi:ATP-binding cassette subfamily F protein 3
VLDAILAAGRVESTPARSYLARFLFRGEDVQKPVAELSGGERSRLELALLGVTPANLLLLDEPTNHLDIPAREALEAFLRDSAAAMLIVSHDRRLLGSVCERLWVIEPGGDGRPGTAAPFDGGYREWRQAVSEGWTVAAEIERRRPDRARSAAIERPRGAADRPAHSGGASPGSDAIGRPPRAVGSAVRTNGARPAARPAPLSKDAYRRQIGKVEEDMTRLGLRKTQLELALSDQRVQSNFVELRRLTSELADVDGALAQAEEAWLALSERAPR